MQRAGMIICNWRRASFEFMKKLLRRDASVRSEFRATG